MTRRLHILFILLAGIMLASCVNDDGPDNRDRSHTLLVYLGGDNNLDEIAYQKLFAIRDGWDGKTNHRIIIYMDTWGDGSSLIEITGDKKGGKIIRNAKIYGRENSASSDVFSRVINDVRAMFPADSYGLLVFSHASGWLPEGTLNNPDKPFPDALSRSIVVDNSHKSEMDLKDFAGAIPGGMFDYIVFEACFMAGIEVAYELRNKTHIILASSAEIVDPGFTPVYPSATGKLFAGNIKGFGQSVFGYVQTYSDNDLKRSATYSVINTSGLDRLAGFIRENCDFGKEADITGFQKFDRYDYRLFFDFEDYYSSLLDTERQRDELSRLISDCVTWKQATPVFMTQKPGNKGFGIEKHSGFTTYIPQTAFPFLNAEYEKLAWTKAVR